MPLTRADQSRLERGVRQQTTYCGICEALCGLVATVEDGKLTAVRADKDNPYSQGFICTKASAMVDITYDPDRVLRPLRRRGPAGDFEVVTWDDALDDIASRLRSIVRTLPACRQRRRQPCGA